MPLNSISQDKLFEQSWNEDNTIFEFGQLSNTESKEKSKSLLVKNYQFNDFGDRVKLRNSGEDFLIRGEQSSSTKNKGKIIHQILASVNRLKDVEPACLKALAEGIIDEAEMTEILDALKNSFENPLIANWFNGKYKVINERNLLSREKILRPDRIMFYENQAIVVDYKTGNKKSENYNYQVKRYAKVLKETGFEKVSGFLWYINQNEVEKVCEV